SSTRVPEGSRANAGIGCHYMAQWMDRRTDTFTQMGGEGMTWVGQAPFSSTAHVFQNIGDGTYFHSGSLAIRHAIATRTPITYKILFNDAVAMTGGQRHDGQLTPDRIVRQMLAEGVERLVVVTDEPDKYPSGYFPAGIPVHHRSELDQVQRELREYAGVSVLLYDQTCAAEKRRRRKRGEYPDPERRAFINEAVCEGCGDCGVKSNCVSVEPVETELGRKRAINQSSCNKDFSCVNGFCPSFVTLEGARPRRKSPGVVATDAVAIDLPPVQLPAIAGAYAILITGIGGTGVVTIGQLLGMAAHLEGKGVTVLDMAGLAQKNGAVMSFVRIGYDQTSLHAPRIGAAAADAVLGCDVVVTAGKDALPTMIPG
ncbi:MAG: indolepyruvate ferredoxin oxidoreductase family protein, partial [Actinobacteria bacterium]|nr:indolepyruvate ferredoxin oxidoreductase family protein [Actinomycetota bacterium]